jgi:hypothetical protein
MQTLKGYVDGWTNFIGTSITGLFLTAATAIFFYAVVRFILKRSSGDAKGLEDAKGMLGWSIVGLTVMFSIWGIVSFLQSGILGENGSKTTITPPSISAVGSNRSPGTGSGRGTVNPTLINPSSASEGTLEDGSECTFQNQSACKSGTCWVNRGTNYGKCGK